MRRDETLADVSRETAGRALNKAYATIAGLLELLEAGLPEEHKLNARNVRMLAQEALYNLRMSLHLARRGDQHGDTDSRLTDQG